MIKDLQKGLWSTVRLPEKLLEKILYAVIRFCVVVFTNISKNNIFSQAGGLSYSTIIGIGPIIILTVSISSFVLDKNEDEQFAAKALYQLISYVAPTVEGTTTEIGIATADNAATTNPSETTSVENINPELVAFLDEMISKAQSSALGAVGFASILIVIVMLFGNIEKAFNQIWGITKGRPFLWKIIIYWACISLGAILGFSSLALFTGSQIAEHMESLPYGSFLYGFLTTAAPLLSFALILIMLASFYKFIPNTLVYWKAALIGGAVAALLLFLNQTLAFTYIERVTSRQSLYGSIAIVPVLMVGLYIFWLFVLIGGQVTYCIQNYRTLIEERVWDKISSHTLEIVSLSILIQIAKAFRNNEGPVSLSSLFKTFSVPHKLINKAVSQLTAFGYVNEVSVEDNNKFNDSDHYYQICKPLNHIYLGQFKFQFDNNGSLDTEIGNQEHQPLISYYLEQHKSANSENEKSLDQLLDKHS